MAQCTVARSDPRVRGGLEVDCFHQTCVLFICCRGLPKGIRAHAGVLGEGWESVSGAPQWRPVLVVGQPHSGRRSQGPAGLAPASSAGSPHSSPFVGRSHCDQPHGLLASPRAAPLLAQVPVHVSPLILVHVSPLRSQRLFSSSSVH